jgi:hypothetical protein
MSKSMANKKHDQQRVKAMRRTSLALLSAGLLLSSALFSIAARADVPFTGTWANDVKQCTIDQGAEGAPLILTESTYDQGEAHCTLEDASEADGGWQVKAKCMVEGEPQEGTFTFIVAGDKLTIRDDSGERSLQRCPKS